MGVLFKQRLIGVFAASVPSGNLTEVDRMLERAIVTTRFGKYTAIGSGTNSPSGWNPGG